MAFAESVLLAYLTKGGVPFMDAMSLPKAWRRAALSVMKRIKEKESGKNDSGKKYRRSRKER